MEKIIKIVVRDIDTWIEKDPETAKKIIEKFTGINTNHDYWYDFVEYNFREDIKEYGFDDVNIYFDLFNSGSGAVFSSNDIDVLVWIKKNKKCDKYQTLLDLWDELDITGELINNTSRYHHEDTYSFELSYDYCEDSFSDTKLIEITDLLEELQADIESFRKKTCIELYHTLEKEYNALQERDSIIETLRCNEYLFDQEGRIRH